MKQAQINWQNWQIDETQLKAVLKWRS
jgi:hypothetical protein